MDFNYLYHRQQVSLMRADAAACDPSRAAHQGLAHLYGSLIARAKAERVFGLRLVASVPHA
jgi:hypothetical protein